MLPIAKLALVISFTISCLFRCLFVYHVCWTRALLADIVKIKMEHYEMSKVRSQSAEEYLKAFFDAELKPIWPQGWIQTRLDPHVHFCELWLMKIVL